MASKYKSFGLTVAVSDQKLLKEKTRTESILLGKAHGPRGSALPGHQKKKELGFLCKMKDHKGCIKTSLAYLLDWAT